MKVYIAAPYAAREQAHRYASELERIGYTSCASWHNETHEIDSSTVGAATGVDDTQVAGHAATDLADIDSCDILVLLTASAIDTLSGLTSSSGGRHVETGYAIARDKPVIVVGQPENVFHRLPRVATIVPTWHEAVLELAARIVAERDARAYPQDMDA